MVVIIRDSAYLATSTYGKFFKHPDFVDEKIHQTQFVTESNQNIKTRRMKGNTVAFFLKFSGQLQRAKAREHIQLYLFTLFNTSNYNTKNKVDIQE